MKIAVIGTRGFPDVQGGVEKHCEELYPRLVKLGCDVTVFTRTPYIPVDKRLKEWKGVKFDHLWCPRKKSLEAITHSFYGLLKAKQLSPDIVHIHGIGPSLVTPLAKSLLLKVVMTHHGPEYERVKWGKLAKVTLKTGERFGVSYSDGIIAISNGIKEHVKNKFGKEATFIPNGVNTESIISPGEALQRWKLESKKYIFTACRLVPEKGLHDLIEAYKRIENPPFKLVIAGDADHETDYSRQLKRLAGETEGVILTGFVSGSRLGELFSNAGLFVLPSYYEGLPIALLEALSYRLPVLVSDIPQHRELPLKESRYFEKGNIKNLSKAVTNCISMGISDSESAEHLSLIKEKYSWDKIALKTAEEYEKVFR